MCVCVCVCVCVFAHLVCEQSSISKYITKVAF